MAKLSPNSPDLKITERFPIEERKREHELLDVVSSVNTAEFELTRC